MGGRNAGSVRTTRGTKTLHKLTWSGVGSCLEALREPKPRRHAIEAIATVGGFDWSTASTYLETALALGLVIADETDRLELATSVPSGDELLKASTLVRLFRTWQRFGDCPLDRLRNPENYFRALGVDSPRLLRTADTLAHHIEGALENLPPQPALLLETTRLAVEARVASPGPYLFSAVDAFKVFRAMLFTTNFLVEGNHGPAEQFVRTCMILYGRNLIRLSIVQYPLDADQPYKHFRTSLGYIKWLSHPTPFHGSKHAEPLQATRKRVSSA